MFEGKPGEERDPAGGVALSKSTPGSKSFQEGRIQIVTNNDDGNRIENKSEIKNNNNFYKNSNKVCFPGIKDSISFSENNNSFSEKSDINKSKNEEISFPKNANDKSFSENNNTIVIAKNKSLEDKDTNKEDTNKVDKKILSYEDRLRNYKEVRARIFNELSCDGMRNVSRRVVKARERFRDRRARRKKIVEAINNIQQCDNRIFAEVLLNNVPIRGLLDTGASVCLLGKNCRDRVIQLGLEIQKHFSSVKTAGGENFTILGKVIASITYNGKTEEVELYLCPHLQQDLYLGIDFWRQFGLAPEIVGKVSEKVDENKEKKLTVAELCLEKATEYFGPPKVPGGKYKIHDLTPEQQVQLDFVKSKFPAFENLGLGRTKVEVHRIQLKEGTVPIKERHFPMSPPVQDIVYSEIDKMLDLGVIKESESPWSNRFTVVRKPDKNRFCLDARKLNACTIKDAYPLQNIEGILSRIDQTEFISSVDLKFAFWQIEMDEASRQCTAFTVAGRPLYEFVVMPFGLCNAAQRLCRLMDKVIPQRLRSNVYIYLDDLLVISADFQTHLKILSQIGECLSNAGLTIGMAKSHFCFKEVRYLGFILGGGCLKTDPEKVEAILKIKAPKNPREVRSFLGTAGWYRRFIKNFAIISAPLTDTLKVGIKFVMTVEALQAFESLKVCLTTAPVLRHADFRRKFFIQSDASNVGMGSVIFQKTDEGYEYPIAFYSQKFTKGEKNFTVTEKECLAVILSVERFRAYIELTPFTIITDHSSLKWLMTLKDLSGRLARWSLRLQSFDFTIEHRKGKDNIVADTLSRLIEEVVLSGSELLDIETIEFESEEYLAKIESILKNQSQLPDLKVEDGIIFKRTLFDNGFEESSESRWKLWVPTGLTSTLIEKAHNPETASHGGIAKTVNRLRQFYYWPGMVQQVTRYIQNCQVCKESKPSNRISNPGIGNPVVVDRPFQRLYIDFLGKYTRSKNGNCYVFIVVDALTKFVFLKAMRDANAKNVVKFLISEIFFKFGVPEVIHSDNGVQFTSKEYKKMIEVYGIQDSKTAFYSPQSNAAERVNQSVLQAIRSYIENDHREWDVYLPEIECALRSSIHSATGVTPFFALFGINMFLHGTDYKIARKLNTLNDENVISLQHPDKLEHIRNQIKENLNKAYQKSANYYNKRSRLIRFLPGQEIYKRNYVQSNFEKNLNAKFCRKFVKCRVIKPLGLNMYELETIDGKPLGAWHAKDLKQ